MDNLSVTAKRLVADAAGLGADPGRSARVEIERLPFTIRAQQAGAALILTACSKFNSAVLGSARIQSNLLQPLQVEQSVDLPIWLQNRHLAEVTELRVADGNSAPAVKLALIKACFEFCEQNGVAWTIVTCRANIDRQYEQLLFTDVFPERDFVKLRHTGPLPHRVMAFDIGAGAARWSALSGPLLTFFRRTHHPDIDLNLVDENSLHVNSLGVNLHGVNLQDVNPQLAGN